MSLPAQGLVASRLRTCRIIHAAMVASLVIYAVVAHAVLRFGAGPGVELGRALPLVRGILFAVGGVMFVGVLVARPRLLSAEALGPLARRAGGPAALGQLQTRLLILLAVAEAIGVYGLVLCLLSARLSDFYALWTPALLAQLALTPRGELWEDVARAGTRP
jgi:F0F1-type ATP synthase membrane subunit c/vacuolar-type H+-ATPase subunit K